MKLSTMTSLGSSVNVIVKKHSEYFNAYVLLSSGAWCYSSTLPRIATLLSSSSSFDILLL